MLMETERADDGDDVAASTDPVPAAEGRQRGLAGKRPWLRRTLLVLAVLAILGLLAGLAVGIAFWRIYDTATIPAAEQLERPDPTVLVDRDGDEVETLDPADVQENVAIDDLPEHVPQAVLAAEDRRFHEHGGFSLRAIARAAVANVTAGEVEQGASTIHQQYVAMAVADIGDGYLDKFREAAIAARLDDEFDDDRILEMYLNQVPFGRTAHGIEAAARTYFGVGAEELDEEQAALLAGMIAAPSAFDPHDNPDGAAGRRDFVVDGMRQMGHLDDAAAEELIGDDLPSLREDPPIDLGEDAYFLDAVRQRLPDLLDDPSFDVTEGLVVHTTLDPEAQSLALEQLRSHLDELPYTGSVVTIESETGAVRSLVGGLDFEETPFNVATEAQRQVGSTFKTFALVELIEQGYDPDRTDIEVPDEYDIEVEDGDDTTVRNFHDDNPDEVDAREATVSSINTAYAQLGEELGADRVADRAEELGISSELHGFPSLVLGAVDLRPIEVTASYATLAAGGTRHDPYLIDRIEDHDGEVLYEHEAEPLEALDADTAHLVTDVLADVVASGTGQAAALDRPTAGKTGTTNDYRDAWFVGYTPELTTSVWVGNLDNSPMEDEISGGSLPAEIWGGYIGELLDGTDAEEFPTADVSDLDAFEELEPDEPEPDEPAPEDWSSRDPEDEAREEEDDGEDEDDDPDEDDGEDDDPDEDDEDEDDVEDEGEGDDPAEDEDADEDGDDSDDDGDDGDDEEEGAGDDEEDDDPDAGEGDEEDTSDDEDDGDQ